MKNQYQRSVIDEFLKVERKGAIARGPDPEDHCLYLQMAEINLPRLKAFAEREGLMHLWPAIHTFRAEFYRKNMEVPKEGATPLVLLLLNGNIPTETPTYHNSQCRQMNKRELINANFFKVKKEKSNPLDTKEFVRVRIGASIGDDSDENEG